MQQPLGSLDELVPIQRRARIGLVGLDVVMTEHALILGQHFVGQFPGNQFAVFVARVIANDVGQRLAQRGGEVSERLVRELAAFTGTPLE